MAAKLIFLAKIVISDEMDGAMWAPVRQLGRKYKYVIYFYEFFNSFNVFFLFSRADGSGGEKKRAALNIGSTRRALRIPV